MNLDRLLPTLGEWLRGLGADGVTALRRVLGRVTAEALALCPAGTVRTGGELEVFFDDTQLEVTGKKIEGAAINYEGQLALGWQALFVGPFLATSLSPATTRPSASTCRTSSPRTPRSGATRPPTSSPTPPRARENTSTSSAPSSPSGPSPTTAGPIPSSVPPPRCPPAPGPQCRQTDTTPTCATSRRDAPGRKSTPCAAGEGTANSSSATPSAPARTAPANPAPSGTATISKANASGCFRNCCRTWTCTTRPALSTLA